MNGMRRSITAIVHFVLLLSLQPAVGGADLFQWIDANGVIHFTDNPYAVPESIQHSGRLLVRKDFLVDSQPANDMLIPGVPVQPILSAETKKDFASDSKQPEPTSVTYSPQEINVVIVNSNVRRSKPRSCGAGQSCKPGFHPDFNDRQYIHPGVFNGAVRQYIHP
jgi:hypothetical protein